MPRTLIGRRGARRFCRPPRNLSLLAAIAFFSATLGGCPPEGGDPGINPPQLYQYANTTDPTNDGAAPVGTSGCSACHRDLGEQFAAHRHSGAGVGCESCHGPGGNHVPFPSRRDLYVDVSVANCAQCHGRLNAPDTIPARDGYVLPLVQYSELRASGGHADFNCGYCHDPHATSRAAGAGGIRNDCTSCHDDRNLAFHEGKVYTRGDYVEPLACQSCHMPLTGLRAAALGPDEIGPDARAGDVRGHIFRIDVANTSFAAMFDETGTAVRKDEQGRAAVTIDFVCLRCHNGIGSAFAIRGTTAVEIADDMHEKADIIADLPGAAAALRAEAER